MNKIILLLSVIFAVILIGCSGSDTYRGSWKATDLSGAKFEMVFDAKSFAIKDSAGEIKKFGYSQNSFKFNNSIETYGIKLDDGRGYQINFPIADNESLGIIKDENGRPMFVISRNDYVNYEDVFKFK